MDSDRFDALLDAALDTGEIPAEATPDEREELTRLLAARGQLSAGRIAAEDEARAAMPIARARFERFLENERQALLPPAAVHVAPRPKRPGFFSGLFGALATNRTLAMAGIGVVGLVLVALVASQVLFTGVESAQALVPGDYAQVQGVVTSVTNEGGKRSVHVTSSVGELDIDVTDTTSFVDDEAISDLSAVQPGETVLVGGTVVTTRQITARTLALSKSGAAPVPTLLKLQELKELRDQLQGRVVSFSLAPDGVKGRVALELADGRSFVVLVDGKSAEQLLRLERSLGAKVTVSALRAGIFSLDVTADPPSPPPSVNASPSAVSTSSGTQAAPPRPNSTPNSTPTPIAQRPDAGQTPGSPALVTVSGVILNREGNILTVQTKKGPVTVALRADTQVLLGESGLSLAAIRGGERAIGHAVQVKGGIERLTGRVIADLLVLGPKPK